MKKTISALFLLLFILIVTCAYQKSATIYSNSLTKQPTPMDIIETDTVIVIKESAKTVPTPVKEKTVVAQTIEKQIEVKAAVQSTSEALVTESAESEEEEKTLLSKLKSAVLKRLRSNEQQAEKKFLEESKPVVLESTPAVIEDISLTVTYNTSEKEIVDHLVEALKQQDLAFKNRDRFMLEIEALIKRALDDRCAAIAYRKTEELALEKTQKVILEERDLNAKKIPEPYTINPGE